MANDVSSPFQINLSHSKMLKRDLPPLSSLRAFEAAARHASFKRAAEELCVTPSSISHHVQKLEAWLDTALFRRLNRKVILTRAGRTYFFTLSRVFDEIVTVTDLVNHRKGREKGKEKLKIIADAGFIECWLGSRLANFQSLVPDAQLELVFGRDIDDYLKGGADLAVHFGRGEWPEYQSQLLMTTVEFPVCSPKLLKGKRRLESPSDLEFFTLLHEAETASWSNWLEAAGISGSKNLDGPIFHSTSAIFDRLIACEGVGLGDEMVAADLLYDGTLIKPLSIVRKSDQALYFLQFSHGPSDRLIELFRDWLVKELAAHVKATGILRESKPYIAT